MTNEGNMFLLKKRIAAVSARMMTWEVTTAFDGTLSAVELHRRFDEDFRGVFDGDGEGTDNRVSFWPLVSFNASDGRKHRYLVAVADEPLLPYRKKFDRCLPRQIALYAIADKILRGENADFAGVEYVGHGGGIVEALPRNDGNLLFTALWNSTLYILVFMKGRLCHWSEENGYADAFDESCRNRVARFKAFLKDDELFANVESFDEVRVCCNPMMDADDLFRMGARDPFWRRLDLDECESMKKCEKRRLAGVAVAAALLALVFWLVFPLWGICGKSKYGLKNDVVAVELDLPPSEVLDLLAWAKGHRDFAPVGMNGMGVEMAGRRNVCNPPRFKLLGIVGDRAVLVETSASEKKILTPDDSLDSYRVKKIGRNDVVFRCGGKEVRYEVGAR